MCQVCSRPCPAQPWAPVEAFPLPAACPGRSVFLPRGRGEACFSSLLRNRASETHNAAVKISGSGWAGAQWPLVRLAEGSLLKELSWEHACADSVLVGGCQGETPALGASAALRLHGAKGWIMGICNSVGRHISKRCQPQTFHIRPQRQRCLGGWRRGRERVERKGL